VAELFLELFSEEIPARMQQGAARDLERLAKDRLSEAGLGYASLITHAGPRRLVLVVEGLPLRQEDRVEELKGPKVGAPPQALEGFLRKTGLQASDLVEEGGVYFARIAKTGRQTADIVAEMVEAIVRGFPWPKSMRWGTGTLRWVRPLHRILCLLDGQVVPLEIDGIEASNLSEGHRFMGALRGPFEVASFADYKEKLAERFVVLEQAERRRRLLDGARLLCAERDLELVEDEGLADEVAGLAEWPTPVLGDMDPAFLDLPGEVIRTSMRTHQKYFAVRKPGETGLAPHFVVIANLHAADGGKVIATGNAKVLSARLSDARFFWEEDQKLPLERRLETLKGVTFHAKLGTLYARVERITALARELAPLVGADPALAERAARLSKADLATGMVGEFPEMQGIMGGYYARAQGEPDAVADAVRDHYKPIGPSDSVPTDPVTVAVALADKLDTLVGFFAIDEKPTGSRDPFALRRAALGVIRILRTTRHSILLRKILRDHEVRLKTQLFQTNGKIINLVSESGSSELSDVTVATIPQSVQIPLSSVMHVGQSGDLYFEVAHAAVKEFSIQLENGELSADDFINEQVYSFEYTRNAGVPRHETGEVRERTAVSVSPPINLEFCTDDLMAFLTDRLKVQLREEGRRHDLVDAVLGAYADDDLVRIVTRVDALDEFLQTDDGANLLAGVNRASSMLTAEAKKNANETIGGASEIRSGASEEEVELVRAVWAAQSALEPRLAAEDFAGAMEALAALRAPVDAFFDKVLVNDPDPAVRLNRLRLLNQVREAAGRVADFSLISG
jgi:glycyl-tRNA synthetase beta chain